MKRSQKQTQQSFATKKAKFAVPFHILHPKNNNQKEFLEALKLGMQIVVGAGSAGTGKTLLSCYHAARQLHEGNINKIILIRAYQPLAGRSIGFLPGTAEEKLLPYYQQMIDYLEDFTSKAVVEVALKNRNIEICSLETIRGRSWDNAAIIVDESQNLFVPEIQALTTRIGENSQMIFCGDNSGIQTDVKKQQDGLTYLKYIIDKYNIDNTAFIQFGTEDICRSGITKDFVLAFEAEAALKN